jgi:hypothetical protein
VPFASVPIDPELARVGVSLKTFRSRELVFHASPEIPEPTLDCVVAAADDAVAFVSRALSLPRELGDALPRDVFVLNPDTANEVLERLDPGRRFGVDGDTGGTFVGSSRDRPAARAIFQWKKLPLSYMEIGFLYAHEWVHMVQAELRAEQPKELDVVVEGEANYVAALFQDDVVPGAGTLFWDRDAQRLARAHAEHPELTLHDLLAQRPHLYHDEISLFAQIARAVDLPTLVRVRVSARREGLNYEAAWKRVVGRDLTDDGLSAVVASPNLAPRPPVHAAAPILSILPGEGTLWFVAAGLRADERVTRTVHGPGGRVDTDNLRADGRGVVAWTWRLREGARYSPRDVEVRGEAGACSGRYYDRVGW